MGNSLKIQLNKQQRQALWEAVKHYFNSHKNQAIAQEFKQKQHQAAFQDHLIAAAFEVVYLAQVAFLNTRQMFNAQLTFYKALQTAREDSSIQMDLKLHLLNAYFLNEELSAEQLMMLLDNFRPRKGQTPAKPSDRMLRQYRNILSSYKRDYLNIRENQDFMNFDGNKGGAK